MKPLGSKAALLAFAFFALQSGFRLGASGFQNGSFETPQLAPGVSQVLSPGSLSLPGWNVATNGRVELLNATSTGISAVDGSQLLFFNSGNAPTGGAISQAFSTTVGQDYGVSFYVGRAGSSGGTMSLLAEIRSETGALLGSLQAAAPASAGFGPAQTFTFRATTTNSSLSFTDTSAVTVAVDVLLDDVSVALISPTPADSFTNGSFELPALASGTGQVLPVGSVTMTGWTVGGTGGPVGLQNGVVDGVSAVDGVQHIAFNGGNTSPGTTIFQTFSTTPGQAYAARFNVGRKGPGSGSVSLRVEARAGSGQVLGSLDVAGPASSGYGPSQTLSFTATTTNSTLSFVDTSSATASVDVLLDNVSVVLVVECVAVPSDLIGWWKAEDNPTDSAGSNSGVTSGGVLYGPGLVNHAFTFDGLDDQVTIPASSNLNVRSLTLEAWINPSDLSARRPIFEYSSPGTPSGLNFWLSIQPGGATAPGALYANIRDTSIGNHEITAPPNTLQTNEWQHVALTYDQTNGEANIFVNGKSVASANLGTFLPSTGYDLNLGCRPNGVAEPISGISFSGRMDEVALYRRALTASEVEGIYRASSAGKCRTDCVASPAGLVGWWPGEGAANDVVNGNNGALSNGTAFVQGVVGQAFTFDGIDDFIRVSGSSNLNVGVRNGLTIEAWINTTNLFAPMPVVEWNTGVAYGAQFWLSISPPEGGGAGSLYANLVDVNGSVHYFASAQGVLKSNEFQHIALTYDRTSGIAKLFANGAVVSSSTLGTFIPQTSYDLFIGHRPRDTFGRSPFYYTGAIDEVSIYSRALSDAEISAIHFAGSAGKCMQVCTPAPTGLVSWWQAESSAMDSAGGNGGTLAGDATYATGRVNQAFRFDGNGDGILVGKQPSLQLQSLTVEGWIKRTSSTQVSASSIFGEILGYGAGGYVVGFLSDGRLFLSKNGVDSVNSTNSVTDTNWHHVAVTKSGSAVTFYVDGSSEPQVTYNTTFQFSTDLVIGAVNTSYDASFLGLIDELSVYNRGLQPGEVQAIYQAGTEGKCPLLAPSILNSPLSRTVVAGTNVTFTVVATGTAPLSYQWAFNGTNIVGANSDQLTLTNVQPADAGSYSVVVSNSVNSVTSIAATLTVNVPPTITQQPQSQTVLVGSTATFSVTATGTPTPTYQWRRNGTSIPGATGPILVINNVQSTNASIYTVRVSNSAGTVTSDPATLTVASGQFSSLAVTGNGVQITVQGEAGANYTIETSSDLSDWKPLVTLFNNPQNWQFTDPTAAGVSQRFYRLHRTP